MERLEIGTGALALATKSAFAGTSYEARQSADILLAFECVCGRNLPASHLPDRIEASQLNWEQLFKTHLAAHTISTPLDEKSYLYSAAQLLWLLEGSGDFDGDPGISNDKWDLVEAIQHGGAIYPDAIVSGDGAMSPGGSIETVVPQIANSFGFEFIN